MKIKRPVQCSAIVKPGQYLINKWDNKQCTENNPMWLVYCEDHEKYFCTLMHWRMHLDEMHPYNYGQLM